MTAVGDALSKQLAASIPALTTKIAVAAALVLGMTCFYFPRVADPDLWWHLKTGKIIAETGDVPRKDAYSFTAPEALWIDHEWGVQLVFYLVYRSLGDPGLTALKTLQGAVIAVLIFLLARTAHRGTQIMVFLIASQIVGHYALYRPQLTSYLFLALLLLFLSDEKLGRKRLSIFCIPIVFLVWANLHGGFVAGLAVLTLYVCGAWFRSFLSPHALAEQRTRATRLSIILLVSVAVTLINPYGFALWRFLSDEAAANELNREYIREWLPLWRSFPSIGMDSALMLWMLVLAITSFVLRRNLWKIEDVLLVSVTLGLAFYSVRNIPLFPLVTTAPLARSLGRFMKDSERSLKVKRLFLVGFGIVLVPIFLTVVLTLQRPDPRIHVSPLLIGGRPGGAAAFLRANHASGNLYNPVGWGGYLLWHLSPDIKVSIDGRSSTVYPLEVLKDNFRFYANEASPDLPLARGADFVLVDAGSAVVHSIGGDPRWSVVYKDEDTVLYAGPSPAGRRMAQLQQEGRLISPTPNSGVRFP